MLIIEGTAELDPTIVPSDAHEAYTATYREPFVHWGLDEAETAQDYSMPIRITPRRVRTA